MLDKLRQAEFVKIQLELRFEETVAIDLATMLRLRRAIRAAAEYTLGTTSQVNSVATTRYGRLLSPDLASDPVARRQHQKCGPAFVLQFSDDCLRTYTRGDSLMLPVVIWGGDQTVVTDFVLVMQALGAVGLRHDAGRFVVLAIKGEDSAQHWQTLWRAGDSLDKLTAPGRDAAWWLNSYGLDAAAIQINFTTPARLIVKQRPLFNAGFTQLFPFMLRRVTAMLYSHCNVDLAIDARQLLATLELVHGGTNSLFWQDWRVLNADKQQQPLGGIIGNLEVSGQLVPDILPFVYLGSLMNLGKNAAYGAGQYQVNSLQN